MSVAKRSITSVSWNVVANLISVVVLAVRSIMLARLLPVEVFGIYAGAGALVSLTSVVAHFGLGDALMHRAPETEREDQSAAVHFTLTCMFTLVWGVLLATGAWLFASGQTRTTLLVLIVTTAGIYSTFTPRVILTRRILQKRLAFIQLLNALLTSVAALALAWQGVTLWALLATDVVTLTLHIILLYVWQPVWRPRMAWIPNVVRYFLRFGSRNFVAIVLLRALDQVDDLWARFYLGAIPLGYYSRAYAFATYPSSILAQPISPVAGATYAELKYQRRPLSQAFFRTNAFLVRSGFFLAGLLALIAPEFIELLLGAKWLPMLNAFRLMLVFTLLDPMQGTVASLFVAVGKPETVLRARLVQLVVLLIGLYFLGFRMRITGVALAVDVMLVVGMIILLIQAPRYVDFSYLRLFGVPCLALLSSLLIACIIAGMIDPSVPNAVTMILKGVAFSVPYGSVMVALERKQLFEMLSALRNQMFGEAGA